MRRATTYIAAKDRSNEEVTASVTLAYDDRHRRRIRMTDDVGEDFLLDLPQATYLSDQDILIVEGGDAIVVTAALEEVLEVSCHTTVETARVAWHIGNRHMPVQILESGVIRMRYDHVLQHMIEGLGAECEKKTAPFAPEPGAYSSGGHHHD